MGSNVQGQPRMIHICRLVVGGVERISSFPYHQAFPWQPRPQLKVPVCACAVAGHLATRKPEECEEQGSLIPYAPLYAATNLVGFHVPEVGLRTNSESSASGVCPPPLPPVKGSVLMLLFRCSRPESIPFANGNYVFFFSVTAV